MKICVDRTMRPAPAEKYGLRVCQLRLELFPVGVAHLSAMSLEMNDPLSVEAGATVAAGGPGVTLTSTGPAIG